MTPTFVCWKWAGWRTYYTAAHVNRLARMLARRMTIPYRLVCITDDSAGVECETFPLWHQPRARIPGRILPEHEAKYPDCFTRLRLFDPGVGRLLGERLVSIDLDCTILDDLSPLLEGEEDFVAARGYRSQLCGSMWSMRAGTNAHVWTSFDPVAAPKQIAQTEHTPGRPISGSDQAWMSIQLPGAPTWDEHDGVYQFMEMRPQRIVPEHARVVFFAGRIKPWDKDCDLICPALYDPMVN